LGREAISGAARMSYSAADDRLDQPVSQFDQVGDEGLFGAGEFVFFVGGVRHQLNLCGR
jgi:hypothetical protein